MKKKLLLVCTTVVFGILTVAGISQQNVPQLSDVALVNIEAIALGEGTLSGPSWTDSADLTTLRLENGAKNGLPGAQGQISKINAHRYFVLTIKNSHTL